MIIMLKSILGARTLWTLLTLSARLSTTCAYTDNVNTSAGLLTAITSSWKSWGGDLYNTRAAGTVLISQASVATGLVVAWESTLQGAQSASPFVYDGRVIVPTWAGLLYSLNASTGEVQWQRNVSRDYTTKDSCSRPAGLYANTGEHAFSRTTPALVSDELAVIGTRASGFYLEQGLPYLIGFNITNGNMEWCTLADTHIAACITQSGNAYRGDYYVGIASQQVVAPTYQITDFRSSFLRVRGRDGQIVWRSWLGPPEEDGYAGGFIKSMYVSWLPC